VFDFDGLFTTFMAVMIILPLAMTGLIIGLIVWAVRRSMPAHEDPAVAELKQRYARGEIDPAEFEVRLRSLTEER
jgi:uncharacterized membrane protein